MNDSHYFPLCRAKKLAGVTDKENENDNVSDTVESNPFKPISVSVLMHLLPKALLILLFSLNYSKLLLRRKQGRKLSKLRMRKLLGALRMWRR